jgi:hypothetical protein
MPASKNVKGQSRRLAKKTAAMEKLINNHESGKWARCWVATIPSRKARQLSGKRLCMRLDPVIESEDQV